MDMIVESIMNTNLDIVKAIHQIKYNDMIDNKEFIEDVKESLMDTFSIYMKETGDPSKFTICGEHVAQLNELKGSNDTEKIINLLESIIERQNKFKDEYISRTLNNHINHVDDKDVPYTYDGLVLETYYDIENIIYESYVDLMYTESDYISNLIEDICCVDEAVVSAVKTVNKTFKGAVKVWENLINLLRKIREMFMTKLQKIQERDAAWLKENKRTLLKVDTTNIEVSIHSDYNIPFTTAKTTMRSFRNAVNSNAKVTDHTVFRSKLTAFTTQDGDLKTGLANKFRTGNPNKQYSIETMTGSPVSKTIPLLIKFCESFIGSVNDMNKEFKDSEAFIKQLEREMSNRNITMENYCYVEEMFYNEMDLAMYVDFDSVLEADGVNTGAQGTTGNTNGTNTGTNTGNTNQKKEKVGVNDRDKVKEKTEKMSDNQLKVYNKICRDMNLGLSTYLTTMEQKYFESITILKGLLKKK